MLFMVVFSFTFFYLQIYNGNSQSQRVLDIGCGTGFQSFLYAYGGSFVVGVDVSENMIKSAMSKRKSLSTNDKLILFPENFEFVTRYNELINSAISQRFNREKYSSPCFFSL